MEDHKLEPSTSYAVQIETPTTSFENDPGIKTGAWEVSLFSCFKHCVPNCCMVSWCPCVSIAQVSARLGVMSYGIALFTSCLTLSFIWFWVWHLRTTVREKFRIQGSTIGDFCAAFCCTCCALAQVATHIKSYKPGSCNFGPPDTLQGYH